MMQSNRSEYGHKRHYSDRSSKQWDDYDDRWEDRREPHRVIPQDSYQNYGGDGHSSTERTRISREYSDSPTRLYSKDSLNRDWSRDGKSSVRRRKSPPDWGTSEKRRRYTEDDKDDYRYRREPEDKTNRRSPDVFSREHVTKDFKHTIRQEEDFKYRKTPQDSRHRYRHEEVTYRQQHDDLSFRESSGYHRDRDGHERSKDCSQERTRSHSTKSYAKPRERDDSPFTDHEDYRQERRFPLNGSSGQSFESDVTNQSAAVLEQKSAVGFQRFLEVLNKGVNVATLTKIVTQPSEEAHEQPRSPTPFINTDRRWSPDYTGRQQGSHQSTSHWSESEQSQRPASPQPCHRSFSPKGRSQPDEQLLQRGDAEQRYLSSNSRSRSPAMVEKRTLTPEDEHKHRQMQDVLQAIGMNLGFEELGQMSHRIQERLYGKKDSGGGRHRRGSRERDIRRACSPRQRSRSSSSRSSFSPLNQEYYKRKDSYSAERNVKEEHQAQVHEAVEYVQQSSSSTLNESEKCVTYSQESAACPAFSQNSTYTLSKPSTAPVIPMYSVNSSPLPYQTLPPAPRPALPLVLPSALPPNLSHLGPSLFLPRPPPFFPYPRVPPLTIFPGVLAQTRHLLPQNLSSPPLLNLPGINPIQPLITTQKSKTLSRPRCLQVIETKQPG
ncbi:cyclin-dependent kinase 12-like [Plectropomus leopardus]|uniref:cyclin-dependent kinase 12-like n=1 Tax=Plectropomus leopardus TaxID=160734 RepID=UPI001C4D3B6F|nr:cyclin-dependent kinase 12-like [Plectropomus leopardus]